MAAGPTEMAEAGAQDSVIQSLAGHMSKRMMDHYSHVRRAARLLINNGGRP
jgi:site-specific recombinase XerD